MSPNDYHTRLVSWQDAEAALRAVRSAVFIQEQGISDREEWDDQDRQALHALTCDRHGTPIATGRLLRVGDSMQIGRLAVLSAWRGQGVGTSVMRCLLQAARERQARRILLSAQSYAVPFYRRFDFVCEGEEYLEVGIPHYRMSLTLELR